MPTYDYKCDKCGHEFETYQSMKDEKLTKCPSCGENTLKRLIGSGGGLIFKGSGFYLTDYKNKPAETAVSSSSKKEPAKTESTPAAETSKTDSKTSTESAPKQTEKKETKVKSEKS